MLKIRRPLGRLIFNMGIAIPGKTVFLIETAPSYTNCKPGWYYHMFLSQNPSNANLAPYGEHHWRYHFTVCPDPPMSHIQSSTVKTRSNIVKYYINDYRNWGKISIKCWIYKRHPIPRPEYLWENWLHHNSTGTTPSCHQCYPWAPCCDHPPISDVPIMSPMLHVGTMLWWPSNLRGIHHVTSVPHGPHVVIILQSLMYPSCHQCYTQAPCCGGPPISEVSIMSPVYHMGHMLWWYIPQSNSQAVHTTNVKSSVKCQPKQPV